MSPRNSVPRRESPTMLGGAAVEHESKGKRAGDCPLHDAAMERRRGGVVRWRLVDNVAPGSRHDNERGGGAPRMRRC